MSHFHGGCYLHIQDAVLVSLQRKQFITILIEHIRDKHRPWENDNQAKKVLMQKKRQRGNENSSYSCIGETLVKGKR